ncbi:MAG: hypothetical protein JWO32_970 [Bacteroidetes bacterium]|nr:hypothetical protein [Bacteroidota bacterium]
MPKNENIVELKISDFDTDPKHISDLLDLNPTTTWNKRDEYIFGYKRKGIKKIRENNYWEYRSTNISNDWIGDHIEEFIEEIIIPRKSILKEITDQFHTELSIVQYMYEGCNPGLYFDKKTIKVFNECGLELNIDLYILSDFKNEKYKGTFANKP